MVLMQNGFQPFAGWFAVTMTFSCSRLSLSTLECCARIPQCTAPYFTYCTQLYRCWWRHKSALISEYTKCQFTAQDCELLSTYYSERSEWVNREWFQTQPVCNGSSGCSTLNGSQISRFCLWEQAAPEEKRVERGEGRATTSTTTAVHWLRETLQRSPCVQSQSD